MARMRSKLVLHLGLLAVATAAINEHIRACFGRKFPYRWGRHFNARQYNALDMPSEPKAPRKLTRAQTVALILLVLLLLVSIAWAMDWETSSGFGRGLGRILLELLLHLK